MARKNYKAPLKVVRQRQWTYAVNPEGEMRRVYRDVYEWDRLHQFVMRVSDFCTANPAVAVMMRVSPPQAISDVMALRVPFPSFQSIRKRLFP